MTEEEWINRHYKIRSRNLAKKAIDEPKGEIVFFGDSITEICSLKRYYKDYPCFNAGISGDYTVGLANRIESNVLILKPRAVFLLVGINDLGNHHRSVNNTLEDYEKILKKLKENKILTFVQSVYPVSKAIDVPMERIIQLNSGIKALCEKYDFTYIDMFYYLLDKSSNQIMACYTKDGLHPNAKGFRLISSIIKPYLEKI